MVLIITIEITALDGTIDLLSGVNYAGIITAPGFSASGNITAGSINWEMLVLQLQQLLLEI